VTLLLALDTSTRIASVALFDGSSVLSETTWLAGREHSRRLLVEVEIALERIGRSQSDLTGVVVAKGPGSYTGVRVALSVAKGIASALSLPAWGVNSLDVLAHAVLTEHAVRAVLEAGRGRFATALYIADTCVALPSLMTVPQLVDSVVTPTVVVGELGPETRDALNANSLVRLAPRAASVRRAGYLAELGWRAAQAGDRGDPAALDAVYVS
jgi:tRNA threonylcarbamoyladenosine biosynthesis protein TsaB